MLLIDAVSDGFVDASTKVADFSVELRVEFCVFGIGVIDHLMRLKFMFLFEFYEGLCLRDCASLSCGRS